MNTIEVIKEVRDYRKSIDLNFKLIESLDNHSRETSLAYTTAQLGKMWLGQFLDALDVATPYPDSKNPKNTKIEPTADTKEISSPAKVQKYDGGEYFDWEKLNQIERIKLLRSNLTELSELVIGRKPFREALTRESYYRGNNALQKSSDYLLEASMWLGMELGRILKTQ